MDYSKYKRFFAFGCSFTGYKYPTWADIMNKNMDCEYHNFGQSGGGNMFIAARITEANRRFKFCETDLVSVMWSTFCREDRWVKGRGWVTPGNIYTQSEYDFTNDQYLYKWADPITFLARDLAIIDLTTLYLDNLPCDTIKMLSVPFNHQQDKNYLTDKILEPYIDLESKYPVSMIEGQMNGEWGYSCKYTLEHDGSLYTDYHPGPRDYMEYLQRIGIEMSDEAIVYTDNATNILSNIKTETDLYAAFPKLDPRTRPNILI